MVHVEERLDGGRAPDKIGVGLRAPYGRWGANYSHIF